MMDGLLRGGRLGAALFVVSLRAGIAAPGEVVRTPLTIASATTDSGVVTKLDVDAYVRIRGTRQLTMRGFPVAEEARLNLRLRRIDVFAPGARFVAVTDDGERELATPEAVMFAGTVEGESDSDVFLSLSPHGSNGWIRVGGTTYVISSGRGGGGHVTIFEPAAIPADRLAIEPFVCQTESPPGWPGPAAAEGAVTPRLGGGAGCRLASIAIETDYEYTQLFGGDTEEAAAYVATLLGAVSSVFERDVSTRFQIVFLRLWTTAADPWDQPDSRNQLFQFRDYWNANMTAVDRDAAQFLSGRSLGGGIAYRPGLCQASFGYSLASHLNGAFPLPLQNNQSQNWDPMVCAHELGHNFAAPHTHCMSPPIDTCAGTGYDCPSPRVCINTGTIMSYCHLCAGGQANIRMEFHARTINESMLPYLSGGMPCDLSAPCGFAGDCDGNDVVDLDDVPCFAGELLAPSGDVAKSARCDMNGDENTDGGDIQEFVRTILDGT